MIALLAGFTLLSLSSAAFADVYWENQVTTKGMPNQPDGTRTEKHYMSKNASRVELGNGRIIITDLNSLTTYHLNQSDKTYMEMNIQQMEIPKELPPEMKEMMNQGMQVTPTNEKKKIGGYETKKYNVSFMQMKGEYWVSKDVKGYEEVKAIGKKIAGAWEKSPMMKQMNMVAIINNMDGFPVQTVTNVMGGQTTSTLKKIEEKKLGDDLFKVPADYKKVQMERKGRP
jgi:hypothetical protein